MSLLFSSTRPLQRFVVPLRFTLRFNSSATDEEARPSDQPEAEANTEELYAYNNVEKKKGKIKPIHTVEEQIGYMKSKAFENAYKGLPVHYWYRRNMKVQKILEPPPRLLCIDREGKLRLNNACPVCRDEYLFFDYRNPSLIKQFLIPGTDLPLPLLRTGLCREQYNNLLAQLLKAREYGTMEFCVPYRVFDYSVWYKDWKSDKMEMYDSTSISREFFTRPDSIKLN